MAARLTNLNIRAAELTHRKRVADKDVLLDRPETFEPKITSYEKVRLPPRSSWHYWQPFVEIGLFFTCCLALMAFMHFRQSDAPAPRKCSIWFNAPSFRSLLPPGNVWNVYTDSITGEAVVSRGRHNKALGVLLLAGSEATGARAAERLQRSYPPMCKEMVLRVQVKEDAAAGDLEQQIASHMEAHTWGVVIIESFERASAATVQALSAAMEVWGTLNGQRADTTILFMVMTVPPNATQGGTPETFHALATPFVEDHLRALYHKEAGTAADAGDAAALGGSQKPITLRGSGSVQAEVPASAVEQFVVAFKRGVGFVVPVSESEKKVDLID